MKVVPEQETTHLISNSKLNRREFLKFSSLMAATLALPRRYAATIQTALTTAGRLPLVWLEFQDCTGDTESFLKANQRVNPITRDLTDPGLVDLLFDFISVEYHETIMSPAGMQAERSLLEAIENHPGEYVAVVEGSIPTANQGVYCTIRGRTALSIAEQVLPNSQAVIALGSCATDGGLAGAAPNPTGAKGVKDAIPNLPHYLALPGCPANVVNLVASLVHLITFGQLPPRNSSGKPYFAYSEEIHEECERHDHYEDHRFVLEWGDEGHKQGWCLFKMGCKGPETDHNCSTVKWNSGTCWPVAAGHGCVGCASPRFWDRMTPFYQQLPDDDDDDD